MRSEQTLQPDPAAEAEKSPNFLAHLNIQHAGLIGIIILLLVVASFSSPYFLSVSNFQNIIRSMAVIGILAVGQTFVILTSGIDISVGAVLALSAVVASVGSGNNFTLFCVLAISVGLLFGVLNGLAVVFGRIPAFITTLATMTAARGLAEVISNSNPIYINIPGYADISNILILGIPLPGVFIIVIAAIAAFVLRYLPYGRSVYSVGSSEEVSRLSGLPVKSVLFSVYVISGLLAGLAAVLYTSYTAVSQANAANGMEMNTITIVVLGGTSMLGGVGSIAGTVYGTIIIGLLQNLFNLLNMQTPMQQVMMGIVLIIALLLQNLHLNKFSLKKKSGR